MTRRRRVDPLDDTRRMLAELSRALSASPPPLASVPFRLEAPGAVEAPAVQRALSFQDGGDPGAESR